VYDEVPEKKPGPAIVHVTVAPAVITTLLASRTFVVTVTTDVPAAAGVVDALRVVVEYALETDVPVAAVKVNVVMESVTAVPPPGGVNWTVTVAVPAALGAVRVRALAPMALAGLKVAIVWVLPMTSPPTWDVKRPFVVVIVTL
jgi:hypothetical protein